MKILIAVDSQPGSFQVASLGHSLKTHIHDEVHLLHVINQSEHYLFQDYSPIVGYVGNNEMTAKDTIDLKALTQSAEKHLLSIRRHLKDPDVSTEIRSGEVSAAIVDAAKELKADMIVIGNKNYHGIEKLLHSNKALQVLNHSHIPVLVIPIDSK